MATLKEKKRAHNLLATAVGNGVVIRSDTCEHCRFTPRDRTLIQGHHDDYSKPLEVRWLCTSCHVRLHRGLPMIGNPMRGHPVADLAVQQAGAV